MSNFRNAKDLYFDKIKIKPKEEDYNWDLKSKYARAALDGLCFKCFYEGPDINHRPKHRVFAFCPTCMADMALGMEKLEQQKLLEINKWFKE